MKTCQRCRRHLASSSRDCPFCGVHLGVPAPHPLWLVVGLATAACVGKESDTLSSSSTTGMEGESSAGTSTEGEATSAGETSGETSTSSSESSSSSSTTETSSDSGSFYGAPSIHGAFEQQNEGPHVGNEAASAMVDPDAVDGDGSRIHDGTTSG